MLEKYCGLERVIDGRRYVVGTQRVVIDLDLLGRVASLLSPFFDPSSPLLLVCDENTWRVAGEAVSQGFAALDWPLDRLLVLKPQHGDPIANNAAVAHLQQALSDGDYGGALAVGSGTVNDITKLATDRLGLDYAVVGTAPSMNGYTSGVAAILSEGVKTTQACHVPVAVFFDLQTMADAPPRMIASGLGDLLSRPVSNADWRLAARLNGAFYSSFPLEMIEASAQAIEGVAPLLPSGDLNAMRGLCVSIALSGMAMAALESSAPASGGEHLISHYLDMVAIAKGSHHHDFHGCQVGVGTLTTASFYERLVALDPIGIDVDGLVAKHLPWSAYERTLHRRFSPFNLADAVIGHARAIYPSREALRVRLSTLRDEWDDIIADVSSTLRTAEEIRAQLRDARGPFTFSALGVSPQLARDAVLHSKDIRARYTILHLASELRLLSTWTEDVLAPNAGLLANPLSGAPVLDIAPDNF